MMDKFNNVFSGQLIERGNYSPAKTVNKRLLEYQNYKKGWLIDWGMETFWGVPWGATGQAPSPSYFDIPKVDMTDWVTQAKQCDIQYAIITAVTEFGFHLWPSNVQFKSVKNSGIEPTHENYSVRGLADPNILSEFISQFRAAGIEAGVYYNLSIDWNIIGSMDGIVDAFLSDDIRRADIVLYWCLQLQELLTRYGFTIVWLDGFKILTNAEYQKIYNAIKSINPDCLVIMNAIGDTGFSQYPYDVGSTETSFVDGGNLAYTYRSRNHGGENYLVMQEIVSSGTTPTGPQIWYYYDDLCVRPPSPPMVLVTQEYYQSLYDIAKSNGAPLLCAVMPDRYGNLLEQQINLIKNLT
jgi:alpha-L-fucosidase